MTKEEAISRVEGYLTDSFPPEEFDEVEEIMRALKQEPCENKIIDEHYKKGFSNGLRTAEWRYDNAIAEIEQIEINGYIKDVECFRAGVNAALNIINKYRSESEE